MYWLRQSSAGIIRSYSPDSRPFAGQELPNQNRQVEKERFTSPRSRWLYLLLCVVTILAGLSTRQFRGTGVAEWAANAGDALWAVLVYLGYALLFPRASSWTLLALASLTATCVEVSQLYHAPWIEAVRRTTLGGLALGWGFAWGDLLCYYVGAGVCVLGEWLFARQRQAPLSTEAERP